MSSVRVADRVRLLELIVSVPTYSVVGFTSERLVYVSDVEGVTSLWSLNPRTGERVRLTEGPVHSVAKPSPRSKYVVFTRDVSKGRELQEPYVVSVEGGEEELLADVPPMRFFGGAWDGEKLVFSAATESGIGLYLARRGSWEKLTDLKTIAYPTDVEGDLVVGAGMMRGNPRSQELFMYDLSSGELTIFTPREGSVNKDPVIKGGKALFESNFEGRNKLYVYDVSAGDLRSVEFRFSDYVEYGAVEHLAYGWLRDGGRYGEVWVVAKRDGRTKPFIDGKALPSPPGTVGYLAVNEAEGKAYYSASSLTTPPKIYEVDLSTGGCRVILDNPLPKEVEGALGNPRFVRYDSPDGLKVPAYVVESRAAGKPGPTVVYVHGGPWGEVYDYWNPLIVGLAASGYHVIAPNFRGSTGYGEDFRLMDIGDPGGGDLEDVAAAVKWGRDEGLTSKVAIMGYSYGGYMTYLALGKKPELWDAGVAGAGVVDWVEMYGLSDALFRKFIEALFDGYREDLMRERSPITYVRNVKAPLCIIHPQNDTRTPLKPVLRYVEELLKKGGVFEAHIVPDMGHVIRTVDDMLRILLPAILFLDKYLGTKAKPNT